MRRLQSGMTLIELLVAMALSVILLSGLAQILNMTRHMSLREDQFALLQDSARFAINHLSYESRMAGFSGCARLTRPDAGSGKANYSSSISGFNSYSHAFDLGIQGYAQSDVLPATLADEDIVADSDILVIRRASPALSKMSRAQTDTTIAVEYMSSGGGCGGQGTGSALNGMCQGQVVMLSDCSKAKSFVVSAINKSNGTGPAGIDEVILTHVDGNTPSSWGGADSENADDIFKLQEASVSKLTTIAYYVRDNGDGTTSLMEHVDGINPEPIIDHIEDMRLRFGIDDDNDGSINRLLRPTDITNVDDYAKVKSVQFALLVGSERTIKSAQQIEAEINAGQTSYDYQLLDATVTRANDGKIRRVFESSAFLRNNGN